MSESRPGKQYALHSHRVVSFLTVGGLEKAGNFAGAGLLVQHLFELTHHPAKFCFRFVFILSEGE